MNVAYHLNKLHKNPALITKIGIDDKGKELMNIFSQTGNCTDRRFLLDQSTDSNRPI